MAMDEVLIRFLRRHPPQSGWGLFSLALAAVSILPLMIKDSRLDLAAGPMLFAVLSGLVLGLSGSRRIRWLLLVPAILIPLMLLELVPPWRIIVADMRSIFRSDPQPPLLLPSAITAAVEGTTGTLRAAWDGDLNALKWAVSHLAALLGYLGAGLLGLGLRQDAPLLTVSMLFLVIIATIGVTVGAGTSYIVIGVLLALLISLWGSFLRREQTWKRLGIDYADDLRWDVTLIGAALLVVVVTLGLLTPSAPHHALVKWLWTGVKLPAGLAKLDRTVAGRSNIDRVRQGATQPGQDLELGRSLEAADPEEIAFTVQVQGLPEGMVPYWRGHIFERYTGRSWTTGPLRTVAAEPLMVADPPADLIVQEITDVRPDRGLRYGIPDIIAVDHETTMEQSEFGTAVGWIGTAAEDVYTVFSSLPAPHSGGPTEVIEQQRYLESFLTVPENLPSRVTNLTQQLTDGAVSQTERALAIETYLRELEYSYEVEPLPPGGDAVDQFLFTMRAGYCTYYASAMAIMARVAGIPSRVAVGYATGSYDPEHGVFIVREADAHAWPELYIDGQGWMRWEPTPIRPVPARSTRLEQTVPPATERVVEVEPAVLPARSATLWVLLIGLIGLALIIVVSWLRWVAPPLNPDRIHADLYRYGRRIGIQPVAGDSVAEYADRLAQAAPAARRPIERVATLLTAHLYRAAPLTSSEESTCVSAWYTVRSILRRKPARRQ
jgi:transglutaminase-like putative cysteine protease